MKEGPTQGSTLSNRNDAARSLVPFRAEGRRHSRLVVRHTLREVLAQRHLSLRLGSQQFPGGSQVSGLQLHEVIQQALDTISDFEREDGDLFQDDEIRQG
jgi:hypothetical protein